MGNQKRYFLAEDDLLKILADLELLVVSLDRIGSSTDDEALVWARAAGFLREAKVFRRLARARQVLCKVFDAEASPAMIQKFESRLARLKYWKMRGE